MKASLGQEAHKAIILTNLNYPSSKLKLKIGEAKGKTSTTKYFGPVCQKPLEQYTYTQEEKEKSLLRCSAPQARRKSERKPVRFFKTRQGSWWSKKNFGELSHPQNIKDCDRPTRKTPLI